MTEPIHLKPTAELAPRVLLPGDPARALLLAQTVLAEPVMFNHHRGLWGYTGPAADGELLTIQSTGMGGPSATIVVSELHGLGARTFLRVGTCGALTPGLSLGQLIAATAAVADDGTSRALGADGRAVPDPRLTEALLRAGEAEMLAGPVASTDLFYDDREGPMQDWEAAGAVAVEMECATLFALAARLRCAAAALLLVTDLLLPTRQRIEEESLRAGERRLGEVAVRALAGLA